MSKHCAACGKLRVWIFPLSSMPLSTPSATRIREDDVCASLRLSCRYNGWSPEIPTAIPILYPRSDICDPEHWATRRGPILSARSSACCRLTSSKMLGRARLLRRREASCGDLYLPLPARTTIWFWEKSISLTRSRQHSISRSPAP